MSASQRVGSPQAVDTRKSWEPTPRTLELRASTDYASLVPELCRQMRKLGEAHGFDLPHEVSCEVRVVFKSKVSDDDVKRLLFAVDADMWPLEAQVRDGGDDDD